MRALPQRQEEILLSLIRLRSISPDGSEAALRCLVLWRVDFEYIKHLTKRDKAQYYSSHGGKLLHAHPIITPACCENAWEFVDGAYINKH